MINKFGGRKFALAVLGLACITVLALAGADAAAFGSIAVIVAGYGGANAYIDGKHAGKRDE